MMDKGKKILIVDDDFRQRDLYVELFTHAGYKTITAADGLEALELALKELPDLIFTGIIMPRMDGFELIRNLRNHVTTAQTPVVLFSHLGREDDRKKSTTLQNVEFMIKGYDRPNIILAKIHSLLFPKSHKVVPTSPEDDRPARTEI